MRVKALIRGNYLWMRYPGEEFEVPDDLACLYGKVEGGWQEKVEEAAATPAEEIPAAEPEPQVGESIEEETHE